MQCRGKRAGPAARPSAKTPRVAVAGRVHLLTQNQAQEAPGARGTRPAETRLGGHGSPGGLGYAVVTPTLTPRGVAPRPHLDDQVHEALVVVTGDGRVGPNDQVSVDPGREVDVLACRMRSGGLGQGLAPQDRWAWSTHLPVPTQHSPLPCSAPTATSGMPSFPPARLCLC